MDRNDWRTAIKRVFTSRLPRCFFFYHTHTFQAVTMRGKKTLHLDLWLQCTEKGQRSRVQKWSSEIMQCACVQGDAGQGAISAPLGS